MSLPRNDFEYDTAKSFEEMRTATNNPHLFSTLRDRGYNANLICLHGFQHVNPIKLRPWSDDLPPLWETNNFPDLLARFDALTDGAPFAVYVWDLITHIEHSLALASHATGLTDQIRRACAVADDAVGAMREILERKGLMDNTTIVLYGDHGDDIWTHGFRGGMTHGTEPYTDIVWTPLMIRDPDVAPGTVDQLASTIDIAPTCLSPLGIDVSYAFPHSGVDLLRGGSEFAYSQNFTANQRDNPLTDIAKAFSVHDKTYTLLASSRGAGALCAPPRSGKSLQSPALLRAEQARTSGVAGTATAALHYRSAWDYNPRAVESLASDFERLRGALATRLSAKRAYIVERNGEAAHALDPACLDTISVEGRDAFFHRPAAVGALRAVMPAMEFSYKLR